MFLRLYRWKESRKKNWSFD